MKEQIYTFLEYLLGMTTAIVGVFIILGFIMGALLSGAAFVWTFFKP